VSVLNLQWVVLVKCFDYEASSKYCLFYLQSHASGKARWEGECALRRQPEPSLIFKSITAEEESRLCGRLEKLGASS
jgi:hypothetical protein